MSERKGRANNRRFWLQVKATLASVYFASMFFGLGPAAVLYFTRDQPWALGGLPTTVLGAAVIVASTLWVVRLVGKFIRVGDGTHVPIDPPRNFVAADAYRWTRNPMYTAYILTVLGEAMLFASLALVIYAAALWLIAHTYIVRREEPLLEKRFGDEYRDYRRRTPRWGF